MSTNSLVTATGCGAAGAAAAATAAWMAGAASLLVESRVGGTNRAPPPEGLLGMAWGGGAQRAAPLDGRLGMMLALTGAARTGRENAHGTISSGQQGIHMSRACHPTAVAPGAPAAAAAQV